MMSIIVRDELSGKLFVALVTGDCDVLASKLKVDMELLNCCKHIFAVEASS